MMSRKDYVAVAESIRKVYDLASGDARIPIELVTLNIAIAFQQDNPRFDKARFMHAALGDPE